jgi:hypothetical protein
LVNSAKEGTPGMSKKFYAEGMAVRFADGRPCCVTSNSAHLDADKDGIVVDRKMRKAMAHVIATALNEHFDRRGE